MNFSLALSVFGFIFVAELPDKTALASLVLATRYKPLVVFVGAAAAFVVQSLIAILVGGLFGLLPESIVHRVAGLLFLVFAFFMWRRNEEEEEAKLEETKGSQISFFKGAWAAFIVVFLAEWGDLTQLATATLQAKYRDPLTIFVGATLALWAVAAIAIVIGNRAGRLFDPEVTKRIAAVIFALLGLALLLGIL
jgi:putative Ca2+/H+ antiporter (TMEM165/GDT1 family)